MTDGLQYLQVRVGACDAADACKAHTQRLLMLAGRVIQQMNAGSMHPSNADSVFVTISRILSSTLEDL